MAFSRSLLIKGLAGGLGACTACAGGVGIYKYSASEEDIEKLTDKQLIDRAGLNCNLSGDDLGSDTKDCSVKTGGKINVKKEDLKEEEVSFTNVGTTKLKVSKSEEGNYSKKLKFVVDSGDITLTKTGEGSLTINKLGQYETYGIVNEGGKYYLSLKDSVEEGKIRELGLPVGEGENYCKLLKTGSSSCTLTEGEIKKVKFDGAGVTVTGGSVSLTITKTKDTSFTDGYRFTFTFPSEVTINGKTVKANVSTDFKIKKAASGNGLTLEKAWGEENEFAKKAGLNCDSNNECSLTTQGGTINIRIADKEKEGITSLGNGGGKIKLEKDQPGYNQGFKFTITTGDITPTDGGEISKLEQYETYEITEKEGKYFLTRKTEAKEEKEKALGLLGKCEFPKTGESNCTFTKEEIKKVKFEEQDAGVTITEGSVSLRITKVTGTDPFTDSLRFTFTFPSEVTIGSQKVKANIPTDFKIKKGENNALTLEKAWSDDNAFANKAGLNCSSGSGNECSVASGGTVKTLSVKIGEKTKEGITSLGSGGGKIKLDKEQAGYNQGLKFTVSEGDVTLTGAASPDNKLEELETYEITEEEGKYYLTRKTTKEDAIKKSLSIPDSCFAPTQGSDACSPLKTSELLKINFDGKGEGMPTVDNGKAHLTISKVTNTTDFPLGYRFTFLTTGEMTISDNNKVKANIPTEFKIKKGTTTTNELSLEKAWSSISDLIAKVGLEGCSDEASDCTIKNSPTGLNVKQGKTSYDGKSKSSSSQGKIKLYKEQKGYIEGLKFVIEENDITLGNGSPNIKLTQYETYGIEEKEGKYYLSRKTDGKEEKIKKLGLPNRCEWEDFSTSPIQTCSITQQELKSVKFKNKKDSQETAGNGNITVEFAEVKTDETTTLKVFLRSNSDSEIKIPLNSSPEEGAIILKKNINKEFRITKESNSGDLSLERTFDIDGSVSDVGLEKCYDNLGCSLKDKLNVWLSEDNYRVEAKVEGSSKEHKVTYEEKISGGYEFTLKSSITLQSRDSATETTSTGNFTTLNKGDKFQIKQHLVGRTNKYFLTKVSR